jgi:hypothetical protein
MNASARLTDDGGSLKVDDGRGAAVPSVGANGRSSGVGYAFALGRFDTAACQRARCFCSG